MRAINSVRNRLLLLGLLMVPLLGACGARTAMVPVQAADLVLVNGRVVTMDTALPEAGAIAVSGDRILAVGSDAEIRGSYVGPMTRVIDLEGRLAIPGFIEGHGHYMGLGQSKMILDLTQARSWDEIVELVAEAARDATPGTWITGRGWHQEKWERVPEPNVQGYPIHTSLTRVSPNNPVMLTHASGHATFANHQAMELAMIRRETPDPAGGEIVRDAQGNATGLLRTNAQALVSGAHAAYQAQRRPEDLAAEARRMVELAGQEALAKGVTSFHDAGSPFTTVDLFRQLADEGALPVRLYVMIRGETNEDMDRRLPQYRMIGHGNNFLTVRAIKRQIDGALGVHGAWLLEPYEDLPTSTGFNREPIPGMVRTAEIAMRHGFQLNTHAIGDRANRETLDIYERTFRANPNQSGHRWRIEHAQHLNPAEIPRFAELGVIASMQGIHATSDGPWVPTKIGDRRAEEGAYVWQKLLEAGVIVTNGTDVPVEDIDPIASFYASVTRHMATCERFYPQQSMTRQQALRSYTINNAYAAFEEDTKGSLTPGKLADIVVLSRDIMTVPDEEIRNARVVYTIVGGQVRYENGGRAAIGLRAEGRGVRR